MPFQFQKWVHNRKMGRIVERTALDITRSAIARHFMIHDGTDLGRNDGLCHQCSQEHYPMAKRFKYTPGPLYTAIYRLVCTTLEDLVKRLRIDPEDFEGEELNMLRLEHLAEKKIHVWLRQRARGDEKGVNGWRQPKAASSDASRSRYFQ